MENYDFDPLPVPPCSQHLVTTLKRRLVEAIETGKASDAKTFLDIIERLAQMDWLDTTTPQERCEQQQLADEQTLREIDERIFASLDNDA
jgi:hypothetical protein